MGSPPRFGSRGLRRMRRPIDERTGERDPVNPWSVGSEVCGIQVRAVDQDR